MEKMIFKIKIVSEDPETGKGIADFEVDGDLGSLSSAVCALMQEQPGLAEILETAVDDFREFKK